MKSKKIFTGSNTCNYSNSPTSLENRILAYLNQASAELTPRQIAQGIRGKRGSVRVILRKLVNDNRIVQPYSGAYCTKIRYDVIFSPLKAHNIRLSSNVCQDVKSEVIDEKVGDVELHVCFGEQRRKISGWIKCDAGMVYDTCMLALNRWLDIADKKLGFALNDISITTFELNRDHVGHKIDGDIHCITRSNLFGAIERIYEKEDCVRHEYKVMVPSSVAEFEKTLKNGFQLGGGAQNQIETQRSINQLTEAIKYNNSRMVDIEVLVKTMTEKFIALLDQNQQQSTVKPITEVQRGYE